MRDARLVAIPHATSVANTFCLHVCCIFVPCHMPAWSVGICMSWVCRHVCYWNKPDAASHASSAAAFAATTLFVNASQRAASASTDGSRASRRLPSNQIKKSDKIRAKKHQHTIESASNNTSSNLHLIIHHRICI